MMNQDQACELAMYLYIAFKLQLHGKAKINLLKLKLSELSAILTQAEAEEI